MTIEFRSKPGPMQSFAASETHLRKSDQTNDQKLPSQVSAKDTVTVAGSTAMLERAVNAANDESLVDVTRVENIRRELARGHYEPDMGRVAEKLVRFERALRS